MTQYLSASLCPSLSHSCRHIGFDHCRCKWLPYSIHTPLLWILLTNMYFLCQLAFRMEKHISMAMFCSSALLDICSQHFFVLRYNNKTLLFLLCGSYSLAGLQHPRLMELFWNFGYIHLRSASRRLFKCVSWLCLSTNCFRDTAEEKYKASITSLFYFYIHPEGIANTTGKGFDPVYFFLSFASYSPALFTTICPLTIKEEWEILWPDLCSASLRTPHPSMKYSTPAPPFLPNIEAQKTLWYLR